MTDFFNRTIVSATEPQRARNGFVVQLKVWFAELNVPVPFLASPLDTDPHGKELWIRAMAGEYGPVTIVDKLPEMIVLDLEHVNLKLANRPPPMMIKP